MVRREYTLNTSDGEQLFVQEWVPEERLVGVICLVHGLGEHSARFAHVASFLNREGYSFVGFDLRGHGRSSGKRGHTDSYGALMEDIGIVLTETHKRYPEIPCFLYGHSMGGNLVTNYVLRHQPKIAGVIVTSPWFRLAFTPSWSNLLLAKVMDKLHPSLCRPNTLQSDTLSHDPKVVSGYRPDPLVHNLISARLFNSVKNTGEWAVKNAPLFQLPLLLMHGTEDKITSPQASTEFSNRLTCVHTLKLWEGLYHELHNELQREKVLQFMTDWINSMRMIKT